MAKKTIISDFSALKGEVSFSEIPSDAKMPLKVTPSAVTQKLKDSDRGLKVGYKLICISKPFLAAEASPKGSNYNSRWRPSER